MRLYAINGFKFPKMLGMKKVNITYTGVVVSVVFPRENDYESVSNSIV
jgi:hypothetical protein